MLMENQLSTRNMVKSVNEEFWKMVQDSIHDQTLKFKGIFLHLSIHFVYFAAPPFLYHTHINPFSYLYCLTTTISSGLRYRLEAEWRNKFLGERVLDRGDLFEIEKASLLREVASLVLVPPSKW